jgi:hypothetical protein
MIIRNILIICVIAALVPTAMSSVSVSTAYASEKSPNESGHDHGCDDADISDPDDRYINQPEKGPSHHTSEFMEGYHDGFNDCESGSGGVDQPQLEYAGERYYDGVLDWEEACSDLDNFISEPCSALVTSDGLALTAEGKATLERIACQGGAVVTAALTSNLIALLGGLSC